LSRSKIETIVRNHLASLGVESEYQRYGAPVVAALLDFEDDAKAYLRTYAIERGLSDADVDDVFIEAGLEDEPEIADPASQSDTDTAIASLRADVQVLNAAVERLASLARQHLGARI